MSDVQIAVIDQQNTQVTLAVPGIQGEGVPNGGTTGQLLAKASGSDYDLEWINPNPGDITGVTAGTGLTGGGTSGDVTLSLSASLDNLSDVDVTTTPPSNGEALVYDSVAGEWVPGSAGATAAGSANQIQYNDGASGLAASADLTWDNTGKVLGVGGDIDLDDGGTYTTTLQTITPTANRTVSIPDATGTVALVGGSNGQLVYNNAGAYAGASNTSVGASGDITLSLAGAASTPPVSLTGTWFSGGTSTTTKPQFLIEPSGTTSTAWSTSGTGLGVNAASGFSGNLLDLQVGGASKLYITSTGDLSNIGATLYTTTLSLYGVPRVNFASTANTNIYGEAVNTLAQRNSTNAQTYRLYNTYTDASNYQRTSITDDSTGLVIDQQYAGTGAVRTNLLDLQVDGTSQFKVTSGGSLRAPTYFDSTGVYGLQTNSSGATYIDSQPAFTIRNAASAYSQLFRVSSSGLRMPTLPTYADNTAATSGGLVAGDVYKTATGELRITV